MISDIPADTKQTQGNVIQFPEKPKRVAKRVKLTERRCKAFACDESNWGKYLWDTEVGKLAFILSKKGKSRYIVKQVQRGKKGERKITIGHVGDDLAEIREKAQRVSALLARGVDPDKPENSTGDLTLKGAFERYLNESVSLTERSKGGYRSSFKKASALHDRNVGDVGREEFNALYVKSVQQYGESPTIYLFKMLTTIYNNLVERGAMQFSPIKIPRNIKLKPNKRTRRLELGNIGIWYDAACKLKEYQRNYLLMLLLTGARKDELRLLRWSDVDPDEWMLTYRDTKNKKTYTVPYGPLTRVILNQQQKMNQELDGGRSQYVFRSPRRGKLDPMTFTNPASLVGIGGGTYNSAHDLRRTMKDIIHTIEIDDATMVADMVLKHASHHVSDVNYSMSGVVWVRKLRKPIEKIETYVAGEINVYLGEDELLKEYSSKVLQEYLEFMAYQLGNKESSDWLHRLDPDAGNF